MDREVRFFDAEAQGRRGRRGVLAKAKGLDGDIRFFDAGDAKKLWY